MQAKTNIFNYEERRMTIAVKEKCLRLMFKVNSANSITLSKGHRTNSLWVCMLAYLINGFLQPKPIFVLSSGVISGRGFSYDIVDLLNHSPELVALYPSVICLGPENPGNIRHLVFFSLFCSILTSFFNSS